MPHEQNTKRGAEPLLPVTARQGACIARVCNNKTERAGTKPTRRAPETGTPALGAARKMSGSFLTRKGHQQQSTANVWPR